MAAKIIDGKQFAEKLKEKLRMEAAGLRQRGAVPKLVAVSAGGNESSEVYIKQQRKNCESIGIEYELQKLNHSGDEDAAIEHITRLNEDDSVTGIIVQRPLPPGIDGVRVQSEIITSKDVEGVNPANLGWIYYERPKLIPCTAAAVMQLIASTGIDLKGREAVIVGHSDIVGKPIALLLANRLATVSICHIGTAERGKLPEYVGRAEILVVAVGKAGVIKGEWIREGAVVIDVGINRVDGKITGDVEFQAAAERAAWITPVPGGVGPVTTATLLQNTIKATKINQETP